MVADGNARTRSSLLSSAPSFPLFLSTFNIGNKDKGPLSPFVLRTQVWVYLYVCKCGCMSLNKKCACVRARVCVCAPTNMQPVDQPKAAAR